MASRQVTWQIDGEWLTEFVRSWFWMEDKPYEKCYELISSCVQGGDEATLSHIVNDILEGRKKFVGVNEFELVDDNENIRPIAEKLKEVARKKAIADIKLDMVHYAIKYMDPYSTVKSLKVAREKNLSTATECYKYFQYSQYARFDDSDFPLDDPLPSADTPTAAGLWLLDEPELVYDATQHGDCKVGSYEFWEYIYSRTKDRAGFEDRSQRYLAQGRIAEKRSFPDWDVKRFDTRNNHLDYSNKPPEEDPSLSSWSGLVSPDGRFYPADFGSHESVAYHILSNFGDTMGERTIVYADGSKFWEGDIAESLRTLLRKGWLSLRFLPTIGYYIEDKATYDDDTLFKPTKEQKDILWEQILQHDLSSDIVPERYY